MMICYWRSGPLLGHDVVFIRTSMEYRAKLTLYGHPFIVTRKVLLAYLL